MNLLIYCLIMLCLMFIGVPIAYSMLISTAVYINFFSDITMLAACKQMITGVNSFTLLALPFFILLGELLTETGVTKRLVGIANGLVGHMKGSMAQVNIVGSMLLAGVQGSASSDTAAIGGMLIPAMKEDGYSPSYAAAVTAASSAIGPMIPPSLTMVVIGGLTSVSIGKMFLGGILPGVVIGLTQMVYVAVRARKAPEYRGTNEPFSLKKLGKSLADGWLAVFIPLIIVVGISTGFFTPTESATFAVLFTVFLGVCVYRSINFKGLCKCIVSTVKTLANIAIIIAAAQAFGWILSREGIVSVFEDLLLGISTNPIVILLIINVIYLIAGCFVETIALVVLFVPIFMPIITAVGIDPVHFSIMTVFSLTIGTVTPPLGVCMYMAIDIAKIKLEEYLKEAIPFFIPLIVALLVITFIPQLTTLLPNLLMP